ncbi:MAG: membrane dipeptidase [Candidatus Bathyarchaeia archaeon]
MAQGKPKKYKGYKSFSYLEAGKDYEQIPLVKEIGRVPYYKIPLSDSEEDRVWEIMNKSIVISIHDHTEVDPLNLDMLYEYGRENRIATGYEGLSVSGLDAFFEGLQDGSNGATSKMGWKWNDVIYDLGMRLCDIAHQDFVIRGEKVDDIIRAHDEGKVAMIPHLEGAAPIENELDRIDVLYGLGYRVMGLVYSESNGIGSGLKEKNDGGLTEFGHQVVRRMNKVGMAIDVAHTGDVTAIDAIKASNTPIFITHAGARALWASARLKPDSVMRELAEHGGVIGMEAAPHTTLTQKNPKHSIESVMEHFEYCVDLIGIDHVSFGPDTIFGDHVGLHHQFSKHLSLDKTQEGLRFEEVEYVKGLENPSEYPNIVRWLVKHGYSDDEIRKAIGENTVRVLRQVWK